MRALAGLAILSLALVSGCLQDEPAAAGIDETPGPPDPEVDGPTVVARQDFLAATSGGASSVTVNVPFDASQLQVTVEFGPSAFTGFRFSGIAACGEGFGPGAGVFPNSSQWSGSCGGVSEGGYTLSWEFSGEAQGTVTVVAVP